jgi:hypothetical protein
MKAELQIDLCITVSVPSPKEIHRIAANTKRGLIIDPDSFTAPGGEKEGLFCIGIGESAVEEIATQDEPP